MKTIKLLLFLSLSITALAQQSDLLTDSLKSELSKYKKSRSSNSEVTTEDTVFLNLLQSIGWAYLNSMPDSAKKYNLQAYDLACKINVPYKISTALSSLGCLNFMSSHHDSAIYFFSQQVTILEKLDSLNPSKQYKNDLIIAYGNIGINYGRLSNYLEQLNYYIKTLKLAEQTQDTFQLASANFRIGEIYTMVNLMDKAIPYYEKSLALSKHISDTANIIRCLSMLGNFETQRGNNLKAEAYQQEIITTSKPEEFYYMAALRQLGYIKLAGKDTAKALNYYNQALELSKLNKNYFEISNTLNDIGNIYYDKKNYSMALKYFTEAYDTLSLTGQSPSIMASLNFLYDAHFASGNKAKALQYALELFKQSENYDDLGFKATACKALSEIYSEMADFRNAFKYQKLYKQWSDSVSSVNVKYKIVETNLLHEFETQSKVEKDKHQKLTLIKESQISTQKTFILIGLVVLLITLALLFFIYRSNRLKQKSNKLLAIAKEKAEQSEKFKQQFLANMSHEIRTPMNAVMGMTNLVLDTQLNPKQKKYMTGVKKASENLLHIINEILDLSKIESGKFELEVIDFSIRDVVEQVKNILRNKAAEKNLQLITSVDSAVPEVLIGDPLRLSQVLMNLVGNAIKFTEKGSVCITVTSAEASNFNLQTFNFSITDTGIGIPNEKLETIFESFSQAHSSDSRKYGGTGLGLTISKQFIGLMGGELKVESVEGSGTTFSFELNMPVGSEENLLQQNLSDEIDGSILNGLKILLVDDNADNRIVCRDTLESKSNLIIEEAANGREAIGLLSEKDFDIVLMDVQMPVMDGYEATRQIRSPQTAIRNHEIPVIALTASVIRSDLDKCRAAGMNDYVPKPFKASQLILAIAKLKGREIKFIKSKNHEIKNTADPKEGVTDLSYLREFCEDDESRIKKYISIFLQSAPLLLEKLNTALTENNFEEVASQVHAFKTKFVMMGMDEVKDIAATLEIECRKETPEHETIYADTKKLVSFVKNASEELIYISNG